MYLGVEMLYKPTGFPSFELISYLLDSDISNIEMVLNIHQLNKNKLFSCGDIKEIYSNLNLRQTEVVRASNEKPQEQQKEQVNITYVRNHAHKERDYEQPLNIASTGNRLNNRRNPKYGLNN